MRTFSNIVQSIEYRCQSFHAIPMICKKDEGFRAVRAVIQIPSHASFELLGFVWVVGACKDNQNSQKNDELNNDIIKRYHFD